MGIVRLVVVFSALAITLTHAQLNNATFAPTPTPIAQTTTSSPSSSAWRLDLSDCGTKKGCWFMPGDCESATPSERLTKCHSIFTWRVQQRADGKRNLIVEIDSRVDDMEYANMGKYISVGFSDDYKMGDDYVIECVSNPSGHVRAYLSFNDKTTNLRNRMASRLLLSNTQGTFKDGRLSCQTTYAMDNATSTTVPDEEKWRIVDITTKPWYFLFARGDVDPETDGLHIHYLMDGDKFPWIATERRDITKDVNKLTAAKHYDIPRSIQYQLVQAHGIMMLFAWWVFAASAMFLSRYFKPMWPDTKLCGQAVWFQLHRALLIVSLILQCSAFALIFIQNGTLLSGCSHQCGDHEYALMLHTYLGITCTAAALIQPFMALARPGPASPRRPIFNWLHWFFGTGSFIIATVTIFLSTVLGKAGLRRLFNYTPDYIMAGYVVAFIVCSLLFEMIWYCRYRGEVSSHIQMSTMGPRAPVPTKVTDTRRSYGGLQTGLLVFFAVAAAALCAALAYFITSNHH